MKYKLILFLMIILFCTIQCGKKGSIDVFVCQRGFVQDSITVSVSVNDSLQFVILKTTENFSPYKKLKFPINTQEVISISINCVDLNLSRSDSFDFIDDYQLMIEIQSHFYTGRKVLINYIPKNSILG